MNFDYDGMREPTELSDVVINKRDQNGVITYSVIWHSENGPIALQSGATDGYSAYLYLAGFATGVYEAYKTAKP